jgi:hypothetical protein
MISTPQSTLAAHVASLPQLPMKQLWQLWDKHFPRRPPHHNRSYIEGRLAFQIQQEQLGGIKPEARTQLIKIGESQSAMTRRCAANVCVVPGTVLIREYDNREHRVTALADGNFAYEGKQFKSLSAAARCITGSQWSGPLFFGLRTPRSAK